MIRTDRFQRTRRMDHDIALGENVIDRQACETQSLRQSAVEPCRAGDLHALERAGFEIEHIEGFKLKKGEEVVIRSCNFSGGPTANLKYVFKP